MEQSISFISAMREEFLRHATWHVYGGLSAEKQAAIADAYDRAVHRPNDPEVASSYRALVDGIVRQFCKVEQSGFRIEPWLTAGEPYPTFEAMHHDLRRHRHLFVFRGGELPADHPLAAQSPLAIGGIPLTYNELFRAVHDIFGHAVGRHGFDAAGEEQAWRAHAVVFPPEALPALTTEIRGQAAWFFFGQHLRRADRSVPVEGDGDFVPVPARPFAVQKATILPTWCSLP